jgi:Ca2+-binding RTX toxin-like protein
MRMNTANKGILATDAIDTVDLVATDTTLLGSWTADVGTAQGPTYSGINNAVRDSVLGTGSIVGLSIDGSGAGDTLYGSDRADYINGHGGADSIYGGRGNDHLLGGYGDDMLHGGAGADILDGGVGHDTASYTGSAAVTVNLAFGGLGGDAQGDTYIEIENVMGSGFGDVITGNDAANILNGGAGNDHLMGGHGGDTLIGGAGEDTLTGGMGADHFVFSPGSGVDHITDFSRDDFDKIDLTAYPNPFGVSIFGIDHELARGWIDNNGLQWSVNLDYGDRVFFDMASNTLYECVYDITDVGLFGIEKTLFLGAAILTVEPTDVNSLHTGDFLIA